jgi:hypothetical protein
MYYGFLYVERVPFTVECSLRITEFGTHMFEGINLGKLVAVM